MTTRPKTLTLNGATLTGKQTLGTTDLSDTLTVVLIGNNVFENDKRGISHTGGNLLIKGTGALRAGWLENKNDIIIEGSNLLLDSRGAASGALETSDNRLIVKGGTLILIGDPSALYENGVHTVIADLLPGMRMLAGSAVDGSDATEISDDTYKDKAYLCFEARTYRVIFSPGDNGAGRRFDGHQGLRHRPDASRCALYPYRVHADRLEKCRRHQNLPARRNLHRQRGNDALSGLDTEPLHHHL